jgi:hypothetical protein
MGERVFEELTTLRELHERQELEAAKLALEVKDRLEGSVYRRLRARTA